MHGWKPYSDIHRERIRAHKLHDDHGESMERVDWDDPKWLTVLVEEVGEVARCLNEMRPGHGGPEGTVEHLEKELVQTAAMTIAWIDAIRERNV
jgi:NTP pyrophosphatase (non-canonical NTP hydrolase)